MELDDDEDNHSSSSDTSSIGDISASAIVNRNLQAYINSMMGDFKKDYPETSAEYKFI